MMKAKCKQCGTQFPAQRASAQFCGEPCKKKFTRALEKGVWNSPVTNEDHEENPSVPVEAEVGEVQGQAAGHPVPVAEVLTTGENTIPVSDVSGWKRPNYWMRLRDLEPEEAHRFHAWLKESGKTCPTDPSLPTGEQDFYHPWAYTEFKNPVPPDAQPKTKSLEETLLMIPKDLPIKGPQAESIEERMKRVRSYNATMPPKHCLTEKRLRAMLKKADYNPNLAKLAFPKS